MSFDKVIDLISSGKPVYLKYDFENAVVRFDPETSSFFVKFKGEDEFIANQESSIVTEAILGFNEITKSEYDNY